MGNNGQKPQNFILNVSKFLKVCYNIVEKRFNDFTHEEIKRIFGIKSLPNQALKEEKVLSGEIVLVEDGEGVVLGYSNPLQDLSIEEQQVFFAENESLEFSFENKHKILMLVKEMLAELSIYELEEILKAAKENNDEKIKHMVIKEFNKRKCELYETKQSKVNKVLKKEYQKEMKDND